MTDPMPNPDSKAPQVEVTPHERLLTLLRRRSVMRGIFNLANGSTSDFYVDVKQTTLNSEGSHLVARLLIDRLRPDVVAVGGLSLGADIVVCAMAPVAWSQGRHLQAMVFRNEPRGHGARSYLEGRSNVAEGAKVAIIEDVTATGGSLMRAVERARGSGLDVVQCLTVVERQEGAVEVAADHGLTLEYLTTQGELCESDT